ncbi:MFS transporter [Variovorax sp. J31P207]|uniref:MFS transporter n=1 Tax=Variovorax sp. J31P207 TaxID=3053510 RepID=UPI002578C64C|nr:MFS transporter [Variovorax sp. J31P207]MDM0067036.1 MFS transporter [Variovorax sp. J31P207]
MQITMNEPADRLLGTDPKPLISAALDRKPAKGVLVRARVIMGTATFFDAFDALAIAFVLPVLVGAWKLSPGEIGALIGAGFAGQLVGALLFGWFAERIGRVRVASITVGIFAVASLACAAAPSFGVLVALRVIQGLGLGGEVPAAAAYVNELAPSKGRGRFFMLYELLFPAGLLAAAFLGTWVVPTFGWQAMFVIGGLPAVMVLFMRRLLPESPRWLVSKGRIEEAKAVLTRLYPGEDIPPMALTSATEERPRLWRELFAGIYLRRTLAIWALWICAYVLTYGVTTWLPTIYRTVFKLSLETSLQYGLITTFAGFLGSVFCAFLIDRVGRKPWFMWGFLLGAIGMALLYLQGAGDATAV